MSIILIIWWPLNQRPGRRKYAVLWYILLQKFGTLPKATLYANKKSHILLLSTPTMKRPLRTSDKVRIFWKGQKIWRNLPVKIWRYSVMSKSGRFFQILWTSQNIRTLPTYNRTSVATEAGIKAFLMHWPLLLLLR